MQSSESVISVCFNASLLKYGGDMAVGAMTICSSVMQFAMLPITGLTQGASPIISFNYGAKNVQRVKKGFQVMLTCCLTYSLALWAAVELFPQVFVGLFTPDEALVAYATPCLRIYMGGMGIFGIQMACQQTFVSIGNAKCSLFLACLRKLILLIPLIYILPAVLPGDRVYAVFTAEPIADVLAVLSTMALFFHVFRKTMAQMKNA